MRALISLALIVAAVLLTGALLSYPAHALVSSFSDVQFHKLLGRITSLSGLCWALIYLRLTGPLNAERAGFGGQFSSSWRLALCYCALGLAVVLVLEVLLLASGVRQLRGDQDFALSVLVPMLITALCVGLAVGFFEEFMYRGALYGALLRHGNALTAVLLTSLLYAAAHHVKIRELAPDIEPDWLTGVSQLSGAMWRFATPQIVDGYIPLLLLGLLLAMMRRHYGQLGPCIGFHVGLVAGIKLVTHFTDYVPKTRFNFLVNYYDHTLGWLASALLLIGIIAFQFGVVRRSQMQAP